MDTRRDDSDLVHSFISRGLKIPAGDYWCPPRDSVVIQFPGDYISLARAAGRAPDGPEPGSFMLAGTGRTIIRFPGGMEDGGNGWADLTGSYVADNGTSARRPLADMGVTGDGTVTCRLPHCSSAGGVAVALPA